MPEYRLVKVSSRQSGFTRSRTQHIPKFLVSRYTILPKFMKTDQIIFNTDAVNNICEVAPVLCVG